MQQLNIGNNIDVWTLEELKLMVNDYIQSLKQSINNEKEIDNDFIDF